MCCAGKIRQGRIRGRSPCQGCRRFHFRRHRGTNFKEGKEILDNSGLELISAENLDDAAKKIVEVIK